MSRLTCWLVVLLLSFLTSTLSATTTLPAAHQQSIQALETIEKKINNGITPTIHQYQQYQDQLRQLRRNALEKIEITQQLLQTQQDLLTALGVSPTEKNNRETPEIRKQRHNIQLKINEIDTDLKSTKLVIAHIDNLLLQVNRELSSLLRAHLLSYEPPPINHKAIQILFLDINRYIQEFQSWPRFGLFIIGLGVVALLGRFLSRHINHFLSVIPTITFSTPLKTWRITALFIASYIVFLMRFRIIDMRFVPALENVIEIIASLFLSASLFIILGKLSFRKAAKTYDHINNNNEPYNYSWLWNSLLRLLRITLALSALLGIIGYTNLALYLGFNILTTIIAALLFVWLRQSVVWLTYYIIEQRNAEKSQEQDLSPWAITIIEPILALLSVGFSLFFWGLTTRDLTVWFQNYYNGIPIGNIVINPFNLLTAIMLFCGLFLLTRLVQWFLANRVFPYAGLNNSLRDTILAISGYIGLVIAGLVGVSALGIDLSNLAIVAGALSVGIGFGLQAIFSNFVSGLILLLERPVKVGDWVVVGEHEGIIRKVRVRSTEIQTFSNASVIVPNSQLISDTVTNWTLHDQIGRIEIAIGVAYGSNTRQVSDLLLQVASAHPEVRHLPEPRVYFMDFGDSSLNFELRCFIHNINNILTVSSELRFAIDQSFAENKIEIPFPQRDLHIIDRPSPD